MAIKVKEEKDSKRKDTLWEDDPIKKEGNTKLTNLLR
jgi:hypothetical protein